MIDSVRMRLTLWYTGVLAAVLVAFSAGVYGLLAQSLRDQLDAALLAVQQTAVTSLANDAEEGQTIEGAADSTAQEMLAPPTVLTIYGAGGELLADNNLDDDPPPAFPADAPSDDDPALYVEPEEPGDQDMRRIAARRVRVEPGGREYVIVASQSLEPIDDELEALREIFAYAIPGALVLAAVGGWFLAKRSLAPAVAMAEQARRISAEELDQRLPVANRHDELGRLASAFNELLDRLGAAFGQQRQFMADASHELRTPVSVMATAIDVTLEGETRSEREYREALEIMRDENRRLARTVEDMFTIARADAGRYPIRTSRFYLDEVVSEVGRAAALLGRGRGVEVATEPGPEAVFTGDEGLVRQMVMNLLDNAIKHTPEGGRVWLAAERRDGEYLVTVGDTGGGIPEEARARVFERFFRVDRARSRAESASSGGAGLGLPIARWIAEAHGGRLELVRSSPEGSEFRVALPTGPPSPPRE